MTKKNEKISCYCSCSIWNHFVWGILHPILNSIVNKYFLSFLYLCCTLDENLTFPLFAYLCVSFSAFMNWNSHIFINTIMMIFQNFLKIDYIVDPWSRPPTDNATLCINLGKFILMIKNTRFGLFWSHNWSIILRNNLPFLKHSTCKQPRPLKFQFCLPNFNLHHLRISIIIIFLKYIILSTINSPINPWSINFLYIHL